MAHNLNVKNGKVSFVYFGETPWHSLGTKVDKAMTSLEALKIGQLDYDVVLNPLQTTFNGQLIEIKDSFTTLRTDTMQSLGVVGNRYHVIQNQQAFDFVDNIVGKKEAIFETAGVLFDGQRAFISCKLPNYIRVNGTDDVIEKYLILVNDFTGKAPLYALFSPIRPVCHNTVTAALRNCDNKVVIRHTVSATEKIKMAADLMNVHNIYCQNIESTFTKMATTKCDVRDFLNTVFLTSDQIKLLESNNNVLADIEEISTKKKNIISNIEDYYYNGIGQDMETCKGTVYGAYQAITGYYSNVKDYDGSEDRMNSLMFGTYSKTFQKAFSLAEEIVLS